MPVTIPKTEKCLTKRSINSEEEGFVIEFDSDFVARDDFESFEDLYGQSFRFFRVGVGHQADSIFLGKEHGSDPDFEPKVNQSDVSSKQRRKRMKFKDSSKGQHPVSEEVVVKNEEQDITVSY